MEGAGLTRFELEFPITATEENNAAGVKRRVLMVMKGY